MSRIVSPRSGDHAKLKALLAQASARREREARAAAGRASRPVVAGFETMKRGKVTLPFLSILGDPS